MQGARAMDSDVPRLRRQRESWQVETLRSEKRDVCSMRSWNHPKFTVFAGGTGNGDPHREATAMPAVSTQGTVLVPADIRNAFDNSHLFQESLGRVADVWITLNEAVVRKGSDRCETLTMEEFPQGRRLLVEAENARGVPLARACLGPPGRAVIPLGGIDGLVEFGRNGSHLGPIEHVSNVEKAGLGEEVTNLLRRRHRVRMSALTRVVLLRVPRT